MADTISVPGKVLLRLQLADSLQDNVMRKWHIGNITVNFRRQMMEQLKNSRSFRHYTVNYSGKKSPLRLGVILSDLKLRHGDLYNASKDELSKKNQLARDFLKQQHHIYAKRFNIRLRYDKHECRSDI